MEHKAFLFDFEAFETELRPILEWALRSSDDRALVSFIQANLADLRDPYEGEPLNANWESLITMHDAHQYGDFALTKYYDPAVDIGLGSAWNAFQEWFAEMSPAGESPILGSPIGPMDAPFDPGKMGSYFQSAARVRENLKYLRRLPRAHDVGSAIEMLRTAADVNAGVYVTF